MIKKILVVDDSALMRRVLSGIIESDERFVLADSANNGLEAYDYIVTSPKKYDLIILDINMPKMNGIQFMENLHKLGIHIPILIVSTIAKEGAAETIRCLELGAFDFVTKPDSFFETKSHEFSERIIGLMCAALKMDGKSSERSDILSRRQSSLQTEDKPNKPDEKKVFGGPMSYIQLDKFNKKPFVKKGANAKKIIAIASSTGGPKALQMVIPKLPANIAAPVVLVQHMPAGFTGTLASRLNEMSAINVKEAEEGDVLKPGNVYIAKGGSHMQVVKRGRDFVIALNDEPPRNSLKPCADIMYESLENLDLDEITCVVLTGMGSDGTRGIGKISAGKNIYVIAQDELSSTVYGMPRMVMEAGLTDEVVPLNFIADAITKNVGVL